MTTPLALNPHEQAMFDSIREFALLRMAQSNVHTVGWETSAEPETQVEMEVVQELITT
jgi:hypothetical protein